MYFAIKIDIFHFVDRYCKIQMFTKPSCTIFLATATPATTVVVTVTLNWVSRNPDSDIGLDLSHDIIISVRVQCFRFVHKHELHPSPMRRVIGTLCRCPFMIHATTGGTGTCGSTLVS